MLRRSLLCIALGLIAASCSDAGGTAGKAPAAPDASHTSPRDAGRTDAGLQPDGGTNPSDLSSNPTTNSNNEPAPTGGVPRTYIRDDVASALRFEVDVVDGASPRPEAWQFVDGRLAPLLDKPSGIVWTPDGTITSRGSDYVWTFDALIELADRHYDLDVPTDTEKIHVMYVDGEYERPEVLGVAWSNRHIALFVDALNGACQRPLIGEQLCLAAEGTILLHEIGHVIGLVDNGVEMVEPHADPEHPAHDRNDDCVMYFAYEGEAVLDILAGQLAGGSEPDVDFDDACKADLAAVRNE